MWLSSVNAVNGVRYRTQRNGLDKLNQRLKKKYNESLEEFADVAASLQDDVISFYGRVDKHKLVSGVDHIINWVSCAPRDAIPCGLDIQCRV